MKKMLVLIGAALTLVSVHTTAQSTAPDAGALINAATAAMGTAKLQLLQYTATGSFYAIGNAYTSGGPWPRFTVTKYTMSIDYSVPAMRQELVRIDDAKPPRGGGAGGYNPATFQGGIRPIPGDMIQNQTFDGRTQAGAIAFWLTPHGFLKGAAANLASAKAAIVRGKRTVTFTAFGKFPMTATLDEKNLVEHVETLVDNVFTGDTPIDGTYSEYRDLDGIRVPMHIVMGEGGFPILDIAVAQARSNSADAVDGVARATSAPPPAPPAAPAAPTPQRIADGIWQLTPNGEGSILVDFKDYVVMVEAPISDAVSAASIEAAKRLAPGKPIKYVINTHHHADHGGGLRAYVAEGVPIMTHESHRKYYEEQIFRNPHSLNPDRLARMPRAPIIETVKDKRVLTDGNMVLEIHLMREQLHTEGLLMVYVPKEKMLIQADAYIPRPGAPPLPAPSPHTISLVDNISRLKLTVERVVHIHGGSSPYSEVLAAAGRAVSTNWNSRRTRRFCILNCEVHQEVVMKQTLSLVIAAVTVLSLHAAAQNNAPDAGALIADATKAMGTANLRSLQYTGTGSTNPTGQAYTTGGAWPRYTVTKYTMSVDYSVPAMRQELVRIDDAKVPRGGGAGGYNPQTFQGGIRPIPGDIIQNQTINGRVQAGAIAFWLTPHGFLKGAAANKATAKASTVRGKRTVTFTAFDKFPITATLDNRNLIEHVEALVDIGFTGDTVLDGTYSDYRSLDGIQVPMHLVMREGGWPTLEINVAQARPNSTEAVDIVARATSAPPAAPAAPARPPEPVKLADHVWQLNPTGEGSILVEFNDYVVMVEAPGGDAVTTASIEQAKRLAPNKPIKYVINSHHHADHAGGMRGYVAEGIPIITHELHRKYYEEQIFKNPHSLNPDRLARMPRAPMLETMKDKRLITDGNMALEIYLMKDQPHSEGLLMMYLPKEKIIMQADAYIPRPGAPPLPMPSPYTTNLVDNISRLKLNVDRVVHIHGGTSPYSDVLAAAGRRPVSTN